MKLITTILLMTLLLVQTFSKCIVILDFELNQKYISKNLCENRFRPQLHCNGNCVLMKKLRAEQEQQTQKNNNNIKFPETAQLFFYEPSIDEIFSRERTEYFPHYSLLLQPAHKKEISQPPQIIV